MTAGLRSKGLGFVIAQESFEIYLMFNYVSWAAFFSHSELTMTRYPFFVALVKIIDQGTWYGALVIMFSLQVGALVSRRFHVRRAVLLLGVGAWAFVLWAIYTTHVPNPNYGTTVGNIAACLYAYWRMGLREGTVRIG